MQFVLIGLIFCGQALNALERLWLRCLVLALAAVSLGGCLGNGALLQDTYCKGKATIVGGGSGFSGINGTIDCGEGFTFVSGTKGNQELVKPSAVSGLPPTVAP